MRFCAGNRNEADALMVQRDSLPVVAWTDVDRARGFTVVALVLTVGAVALRVAGVPPVDLHSPFHYLGIMDPGCGGTRAMFLLASGDFAGAAYYNPVVFPLVLAVLVLLVRAVIGWTTRRWLSVRLPNSARRAVAMTVLILMIALWVRQQALADLMTGAPDSGWLRGCP